MEISPVDPGITADESKSILQGEIRPFPGNVSTMEYFHQFMSSQPQESKSKVALIIEERKFSFHELEVSSTKIAIAIQALIDSKPLKNQNPDNDWIIALCLPPSEKLIFCMFAIHKLGAAYVPIDHTFPENRVISMVKSCRPVLIISDAVSSTLSKFDAVLDLAEVVSVDNLMQNAKGMEDLEVIPLPSSVKAIADRVAIVLYTSGSSGPPKGVRLKHCAIMNRLNWQWETFPFVENEKCCFKTALTFVDSVAEIFGPLLRGLPINIFSKHTVSNPNLFIKKIYATGITRIVVVPSLLRALLTTLDLLGSDEAKGSQKLNSIRLWVCSGETLQKDLLSDFFVQFPSGTTLANFYGSTEIMADVSFEIFSSAADVEKQVDGIHVPIGSPIYNTILYILNEDLKVVTPGEIGELYVAGYNLCSGYVGLNNVDKFIPNPISSVEGFKSLFKTGDFVRVINKNGRQTLLYEGRSDSQVKVRGQRVDLNEIESVLNGQSDLINRAFVLCYNAGKQDQSLIAFVIPASAKVTSEELSLRVKGTLKPYEIPEVRTISEVPLLVNGKVDRQRLLTNYENEQKTNENVDLEKLNFEGVPVEHIEQARALVAAISEVTHVPQRYIAENLSDSFFNLGGTSLNSVTVVTKLRMKNFHIRLEDFVTAVTLRAMITKITRATSIAADVAAIAENESYFAEFLSEAVKQETSDIIAYSFSRKGDLEVYTNSSFQDFKELIINLYPTLLEKGLSFIVRRKSDKKAIATALNFDLNDEPEEIIAAPGIQTVLEFLEYLETRQRDKLPKGVNKVIHSFMMGTHESVTVAENVPLVTFMEKEITRIAQVKGFLGVMTTNTNPLTMQICSELLGYETLVEYQVNQYEASDGSRPFKLAPDSQTVNCCWKRLEVQGIPAFPGL